MADITSYFDSLISNNVSILICENFFFNDLGACVDMRDTVKNQLNIVTEVGFIEQYFVSIYHLPEEKFVLGEWLVVDL